MNINRSLTILYTCCLIIVNAQARQLQTPMGKTHFYLPYQANEWKEKEYSFFARGYHRRASDAFFKDRQPPESLCSFINEEKGNKDKLFLDTQKRCGSELAELMLTNASASLGNNLFAKIDYCNEAKTLFTLLDLCNAIKISEQGVLLTGQIAPRINEKQRWGIRATMPIKRVAVKTRFKKNPNITGDNVVGITKENDFAYRLDALSRFSVANNANPEDSPLVKYGNIETDRITSKQREDGLRIQIREPFINNTCISSEDVTIPETSAHVLRSRCKPTCPFGSNDVDSFIPLADDGKNLTEGQRGRFQPEPVVYQKLQDNVITQGDLWVVPTLDENEELTRGAKIIDENVRSLFFLFTQADTNFESTALSGLGDVEIEAFFNQYHKKFFFEALVGVTLPTGKKKDPQNVFEQPLGSNGHTQLTLGYAWHYPISDFCTIFNDGRYSIALPRDERILASFATPGIVNVGECTKARIWWQQYMANFAIIFHETRSNRLGIMIDYQLFAKEKDQIEFKSTFVKDFFDVEKKLNSQRAANRSNLITHKIATECFVRIEDHVHLFANIAHAISGKNAPQETDFSAGIIVRF
jgi:hypothetical protein